jgi:hypothetical protein
MIFYHQKLTRFLDSCTDGSTTLICKTSHRAPLPKRQILYKYQTRVCLKCITTPHYLALPALCSSSLVHWLERGKGDLEIENMMKAVGMLVAMALVWWR